MNVMEALSVGGFASLPTLRLLPFSSFMMTDDGCSALLASVCTVVSLS